MPESPGFVRGMLILIVVLLLLVVVRVWAFPAACCTPCGATDGGNTTGSDTGSITGADTGSITGADTGSITGSDTGSVTGADTGSITGSDAGGSVSDRASFLRADENGHGARMIVTRAARGTRRARTDTVRVSGDVIRIRIRSP